MSIQQWLRFSYMCVPEAQQPIAVIITTLLSF